jgi:dolichol-phosphate mannosyltransferase
MSQQIPVFSFIVPCFNEEDILPLLHDRLSSLLASIEEESEVIFIDDGSDDATYEILASFRQRDSRMKILRFSRNFGHQIAISAGLDFCSGKAAIILDADLQDPPEVVLQMIEQWEKGYEVVYGKRIARKGETYLKKVTASWFYRLLASLVDFDVPEDVGDFRLVDRKAIHAFRALGEGSRFVRGLFSWMGFRQIAVEYERDERAAGETKYPLKKMLRLAINAVVGFSDKPLRIATSIGFALSVISLTYAIIAIILKVGGFYTVPGWASLATLICFIGGGQLLVLGIIGEYISRICDEVRQRPLYIVRDLDGIDSRESSLNRRVLPESL